MSLQLKSIITPEAENLFVLKGTDLFRRPLKQIGNSIFKIKTTFVKKGEFNVVPKDLDSALYIIKESICDRINDGNFQGKCFDLFRDDISSDTKASDTTIFLYEYLPMALGIQENLQPPDIICDVLIVQPNFPVLLLTVMNDQDLSKVRLYNTRLARSTSSCLSRFIDEDFNLVSGVIKQTDLNKGESFAGVIKHLVSRATCFVTSNSLFVGMDRYDKIITAVFASICETQSVQLNDDDCKFLHFLTQEQGEILVEKLNSSHVNVVSTPKTGSTTLLLEVVRRLSSIHKTLLICRTREEGKRLRLFHPDTVSLADLPLSTLSEYLAQWRHVIDETGTVKSHKAGKLWEFTKEVHPDQGVLKEKSSMQESRDHEAYSSNDDSEKGGPTLPSKTVEGLDVMKETGPILTESDMDVHIAALESQIQAMRAKLLHQEEGIVKQELKPEWSSTKHLHQMEEMLNLKPQWFSAQRLDHTKGMSLQKVKIKQEPTEIPTDYGSESGDPFVLVGEPDAQCQVSCPSMTLDSDRVYRKLHVSEDGLELVNTKRRGDFGGFSQFYGTRSRLPLPLPPSASTLTTPRYWETRTRVRAESVKWWRTLLEMGVCGEREVNTNWLVSYQPRDSWAVKVGGCETHNGICTQVWSEARQVGECRTNTMSNTPGTTQDLHYGVVLDVGRGVVAFLDLDREVVLSSFNVQFRESLRPMFGVWSNPSYYTVKMRLVSGGEITMTDTKKHLIYQALSTT